MSLRVAGRVYSPEALMKLEMNRLPAFLKSRYESNVIEREALTGKGQQFYDISSLLWTGLFGDSPRLFIVDSMNPSGKGMYTGGMIDTVCFTPTAYDGPLSYQLGVVMHEFRHRSQSQSRFSNMIDNRSAFTGSGIFDDRMADVAEYLAADYAEKERPRELDAHFVGIACGMIEDLRALMTSDPSLLKDILFMTGDTSEEVLKRLSGFTSRALFRSAYIGGYDAFMSAKRTIPTDYKIVI